MTILEILSDIAKSFHEANLVPPTMIVLTQHSYDQAVLQLGPFIQAWSPSQSIEPDVHVAFKYEETVYCRSGNT